MSITGIRFRAEGETLVLQVCEYTPRDAYYGSSGRSEWRDAKVTDLLNVAPFFGDWNALVERVERLESSRDIGKVEPPMDWRSA